MVILYSYVSHYQRVIQIPWGYPGILAVAHIEKTTPRWTMCMGFGRNNFCERTATTNTARQPPTTVMQKLVIYLIAEDGHLSNGRSANNMRA